MSDQNTRRRFLRNSLLVGLGTVAAPTLVSARKLSIADATPSSTELTTIDFYGQGPFYTPNAPTLVDGLLSEAAEGGDPLILTGCVLAKHDLSPIANVEIDVWHADETGAYDNSGYNLRGKTYTDSEGRYTIKTIKPGLYLNGSTFRPSHIHFRITPPGGDVLITQLYFEDDPYIPTDAAASIDQGTFDATDRIISLNTNIQDEFEGVWDIILDVTTSMTKMVSHETIGTIYNGNFVASSNELVTSFGVFQDAGYELKLLDSQGNVLEVLDQARIAKGKVTRSYALRKKYPSGIYLLTLKINELQVLPLKVVF